MKTNAPTTKKRLQWLLEPHTSKNFYQQQQQQTWNRNTDENTASKMNSHSQQPKWAHGGCVTKTAKKKLQHQQLNDRKRDKHEPHKLRKLSQKTTKKGEKNVVAENLIRTFGNVSGEGKGHIGRVKGERRGAMMVPGRGMEVARWIGSWCGESCGIRSLGGRDTGARGTECARKGRLTGGRRGCWNYDGGKVFSDGIYRE